MCSIHIFLLFEHLYTSGMVFDVAPRMHITKTCVRKILDYVLKIEEITVQGWIVNMIEKTCMTI
jgi:hypothetical protein